MGFRLTCSDLEKNITEIIKTLSSGPARKYIEDHENDDIRKIVLKHKEILGIPTAHLIEQIATRRKAKEKLPLYYNTQGIIFPPPENLEQSSSEKTAMFKGEILEKLLSKSSSKGVDLTGGFGVDTFFISKVVSVMHYVDPEATLLQLAAHNHKLLGAGNIEYHSMTAEEFLNGSSEVDFIYADPSRRTGSRQKIHALEESKPDIIKLAERIFSKTRWLLVKASPLFDIQAGVDKIPFVRDVYVISVNNECKELLFLSEKNNKDTPKVHAINIHENRRDEPFTFSIPEEQQQDSHFSEPLKYLYEPNASILKAGAFKTIGNRFNLRKIQASTHLYTGNEMIDSFPGRKFFVEALIRPDASEVKRYFPDNRANVTTRNYPLSVDALKKKTGLQDGGEKFLIGFAGRSKKYLAVAQRL